MRQPAPPPRAARMDWDSWAADIAREDSVVSRVPPQSLEVAVSLKGCVVAGWAVEAREAASRERPQPDEGRACVTISHIDNSIAGDEGRRPPAD